MLINLKFTALDSGNSSIVEIEEPDHCPQCKHAIKPQLIHASWYTADINRPRFAATFLCKNCYMPFLALYESKAVYEHPGATQRIFVEPNRFVPRDFDPRLEKVSPSFKTIYNQALAAENASLDQIAGMGYRKALEFLIKDFLIHQSPEEEETIKEMLLGNCIANKVTNPKLKEVAKCCAWLGNDQTHYVQKYSEYDIEDLKRFIEAAVFWICSELVSEEAMAMDRRDR